MQHKSMKKALACVLAGTMTFGMSTTVFAQTGDATGTGTGTGTGTFEGHVDKDVVAVTLPTATATTFAYKMDPEGLIAATNSAKYSDASFEAGKNVYFLSSTDTWTSESEKLKVVNKGTVDVDVTVSAKTDANSEVAMSTTDTFESTDEDAKLYLGLKVANQPAVAVDTAGTTGKVVVGLKGNEENFEITTTDSGYAFSAKSGVPDTAWNNFEFGLTGACNPNGDYSAEGLAGSDVTVTWSYAVRAEDSTAPLLTENAVSDAAPSITTTSYTLTAGTPLDIAVNLGAGTKIATTVKAATNADGSINYLSYGDTYVTYDATSKKVTLTAAMVDACMGSNMRTLNITFDDSDSTSIPVSLSW